MAVWLLSACAVPDLGAPCARHSDCGTSYCSAQGTCAVIPTDAGAPDDSTTMTIPPFEGGIDDASVTPPADAPPDAIDD